MGQKESSRADRLLAKCEPARDAYEKGRGDQAASGDLASAEPLSDGTGRWIAGRKMLGTMKVTPSQHASGARRPATRSTTSGPGSVMGRCARRSL